MRLRGLPTFNRMAPIFPRQSAQSRPGTPPDAIRATGFDTLTLLIILRTLCLFLLPFLCVQSKFRSAQDKHIVHVLKWSCKKVRLIDYRAGLDGPIERFCRFT